VVRQRGNGREDMDEDEGWWMECKHEDLEW